LHDPFINRIAGVGLPEGCSVPIDDPICTGLIAQRRPDTAGHIAALIGRVYEEVRICHRIDVLTESDQPQMPLIAENVQARLQAPIRLPHRRVVKGEKLSRHCAGQE